MFDSQHLVPNLSHLPMNDPFGDDSADDDNAKYNDKDRNNDKSE